MAKPTAANSNFLKNVKRLYNAPIYRAVLKVAQSGGIEAAEQWLLNSQHFGFSFETMRNVLHRDFTDLDTMEIHYELRKEQRRQDFLNSTENQ